MSILSGRQRFFTAEEARHARLEKQLGWQLSHSEMMDLLSIMHKIADTIEEDRYQYISAVGTLEMKKALENLGYVVSFEEDITLCNEPWVDLNISWRKFNA